MIHALAVVAFGLTSSLTSMVELSSWGDWPVSWPKEFEAYRKQSLSAMPMTAGNILDLYQISFKNREEFDQLWPAIVKLMDRGSQITVNPTGLNREYFGESDWGYDVPIVRIFAAPEQSFGYPPGIDQSGRHISSMRVELHRRFLRNETLSDADKQLMEAEPIDDRLDLDPEAMKVNNGRWVMSGPPWPDDVRNEKGELPELVHWEDVDGTIRWLAGPWKDHTFGVQCRIDIELVVDGKIIDFEQIRVPGYFRVVDKRPVAKPAKTQP